METMASVKIFQNSIEIVQIFFQMSYNQTSDIFTYTLGQLNFGWQNPTMHWNGARPKIKLEIPVFFLFEVMICVQNTYFYVWVGPMNIWQLRGH